MYFNGESIRGWNCPRCKQKRDAVKKLDISKLPPILVIHFKRYLFSIKLLNFNYFKNIVYCLDFMLMLIHYRIRIEKNRIMLIFH